MASVNCCERVAIVSMVIDDLSRKALRDLIEARAHHLLQAGRKVGEFVVHVFGLEIEAGREAVARR